LASGILKNWSSIGLENPGSLVLKVTVLKVLMSTTGTRPKSVELYGAGAQT